MTEKRVSVRLAVVGGREVRAELQGIGEAGETSMRRLSRDMDAANTRVAAFSRRAQIAAAAAATAFAAGATAMIRSGLQVIDSQAKLAASLGITVESIQVLERAGELSGVAMSGIEQATKDLTRRLSQAAAGTGPAVAPLNRDSGVMRGHRATITLPTGSASRCRPARPDALARGCRDLCADVEGSAVL